LDEKIASSGLLEADPVRSLNGVPPKAPKSQSAAPEEGSSKRIGNVNRFSDCRTPEFLDFGNQVQFKRPWHPASKVKGFKEWE